MLLFVKEINFLQKLITKHPEKVKIINYIRVKQGCDNCFSKYIKKQDLELNEVFVHSYNIIGKTKNNLGFYKEKKPNIIFNYEEEIEQLVK